MGIILIGIIGFGIDILMRMAEKVLVPWKGAADPPGGLPPGSRI